MHKPLKSKLVGAGFDIVDEFICRGFMNYSFLKLFFGGINKNRPNQKDLEEAEKFARNLNFYL